MDLDAISEYRFNVFMLSFLGFWPYLSKYQKLVRNTIVGIIIGGGLVFQLTTFITETYDTKLLLRNLSPIIIALGFNLKYYTILLLNAKLKTMFDRMKADWNTEKTDKEMQIMKEHALLGKHHSIIFAMFIYPAPVFFMVMLCSSQILDFFVPLNESRPYRFPVMTEYFIDEQKHYYIVSFIHGVTGITVSLTFIATENIIIMIMEHACCLCDITCYRIRQAYLRTSSRNPNCKGELEVRQVLVSAVQMHIDVLEFTKQLKDNFRITYAVLLAFGIAALSINLYRIYQALLFSNDIEEILLSAAFVIGIFGYMFYLNYMSQRVLDWDNEIFMELSRSYNVAWNSRPFTVKSIILFAMLRSSRTFNFELFGTFNPSMEGFTAVAKLSVSYFMVLYTSQ